MFWQLFSVEPTVLQKVNVVTSLKKQLFSWLNNSPETKNHLFLHSKTMLFFLNNNVYIYNISYNLNVYFRFSWIYAYSSFKWCYRQCKFNFVINWLWTWLNYAYEMRCLVNYWNRCLRNNYEPLQSWHPSDIWGRGRCRTYLRYSYIFYYCWINCRRLYRNACKVQPFKILQILYLIGIKSRIN